MRNYLIKFKQPRTSSFHHLLCPHQPKVLLSCLAIAGPNVAPSPPAPPPTAPITPSSASQGRALPASCAPASGAPNLTNLGDLMRSFLSSFFFFIVLAIMHGLADLLQMGDLFARCLGAGAAKRCFGQRHAHKQGWPKRWNPGSVNTR